MSLANDGELMNTLHIGLEENVSSILNVRFHIVFFPLRK